MKRKDRDKLRTLIPGVSHVPFKDIIFSKSNLTFISQFIGPVLMLLIAGVIIVLAQWLFLNRRGESFTVGAPAPETYRVISHIRYDDQDAAQNLRLMVSESVVGVTVRDMSAKSRLQRRLEALRDMTVSSQTQNYLSYIPDALLNAIAKLDNAERARVLNLAYQVGSAYIDRLEAANVFMDSAAETSMLWEEIGKLVPSVEDANLIYQILAKLGNLNFRVDDELTSLARQAAVSDVPAIDRRLEPGDVIVSRGEIVTSQTALLLRLQGYTEDVFPFTQLCVVLVSVLMLPLWLNILWHGAGERRPTWWCVVFIIIIAWSFETIGVHFGVYGAGVLPSVTAAYLCIPDYLAFCIALIGTSSGVFIIAGQTISNLILLLTMAIVASTAGFYLMRNLESRRQVTKRTFAMAFVLTLARMFMQWTQGPALTQDSFRLFIPLGEFWQTAGLFFIFEALATHFILVFLPLIEAYIGTLSILSLREVSHPSSPLLRDLQRNAPGTYQHCLTIATLIEAVGIELGMDVNLLRAGAYYHDIGKLRRPHFFVENQRGGLNVHDDMSPMLSAITIISHVKDGLEFAWEAKLPQRIRDFIAEHHGTTCARYFYNKAVAMGENVEWSAFCYPGPKPQSRETALLMIVDSVEAATRAANIRELEAEDTNRDKGHTVSTIEKIVNQVVASKINEGQFDDVSFTQKDLTRIKQTLISVLMSMYHTRKVKRIERKNSK